MYTLPLQSLQKFLWNKYLAKFLSDSYFQFYWTLKDISKRFCHFEKLPCHIRINLPLVLFPPHLQEPLIIWLLQQGKKKSLLVVFSNTQIRSVAGHSFICLLAMPILIFVNFLLTSLTVLTDGIFGCLCLSIYSHLHFLNAITLYTWQTSCFYLHVNNVMSELGCLFCFVCLLV